MLGALGWGRNTFGGLGGPLAIVRNLNDSGPGSLREAVSGRGPRIVWFDVAGWVVLQSPLSITNPYITIAAQTAPGQGIGIRGAELTVKTQQVIIRGLRSRPGFGTGSSTNAIQIASPTTDLIIDHCSFSWAPDALMNTYRNRNTDPVIQRITIQNCFIGEVLNDHAVNLGAGQKDGVMKHLEYASFLRNIILDSKHRNPKWIGRGESVNNLVYNWSVIAADVQLNAQVDFVSNVYRRGPSSSRIKTITLAEPAAECRVYVAGNITPELPNGTGDQWLAVDGDRQFQSTTRLWDSGYVPMPASEVENYCLVNCGATPRDATDARLAGYITSGGGMIISNESEVGGHPPLTGVTRTDAERQAILNRYNGDVEAALESFYDVAPPPPSTTATLIRPTQGGRYNRPLPVVIEGSPDCRRADITIDGDLNRWAFTRGSDGINRVVANWVPVRDDYQYEKGKLIELRGTILGNQEIPIGPVTFQFTGFQES